MKLLENIFLYFKESSHPAMISIDRNPHFTWHRDWLCMLFSQTICVSEINIRYVLNLLFNFFLTEDIPGDLFWPLPTVCFVSLFKNRRNFISGLKVISSVCIKKV